MSKTNPQAPCAATVGMFDGVHLGHRHILRKVADEARRCGAEPVAFTFDRHPLQLIRPESVPPMLCTLEERVSLIRSAGIGQCVVLEFDGRLRSMTAGEFIAMLAADYGVGELVMGYDHGFGSDRLRDTSDYEAAAAPSSVRIVRCDRFEVGGHIVSSSEVRRALSEGRAEDAALMLGRPYSLAGHVVAGRQLGRTIGFPTANIEPRAGLAVPAPGVYCARARVGDTVFPAMVNIGHNPTVATGAPLSIEAHLIGFDGDLYGREMTLEFIGRLRDERHFGSVGELAAQLARDRDKCLQMQI